MPRARTARCTRTDAGARLRAGLAYLEAAELILDETAPAEFATVAAGLAVLAGIAAVDAICCLRLQARHRGDDHRGATTLLRQATPDGPQLAATLLRLLELKDEAHYGISKVSSRKAHDATKWAARLIKRAAEETER